MKSLSSTQSHHADRVGYTFIECIRRTGSITGRQAKTGGAAEVERIVEPQIHYSLDGGVQQ